MINEHPRIPLVLENNLRYTNPAAVLDVSYRPGSEPQKGKTASGYGSSLPTPYSIRFADGKWRRVKAMAYGNAGSLFVTLGGKLTHLDSWTEGYLEDARDGRPFNTSQGGTDDDR